jgi:hypothetical protein
LKDNGKFIFMTPNLYGFRTFFAKILPNKLQKPIVKFLDEREDEEIFPPVYRANTKYSLDKALNNAGLERHSLIMFQGYPSTPFSLILTRLLIRYERLINKYGFFDFLRSVIIGIYCKRSY